MCVCGRSRNLARGATPGATIDNGFERSGFRAVQNLRLARNEGMDPYSSPYITQNNK